MRFEEMTQEEVLEVEGGGIGLVYGIVQAVKIVAPVIATTYAVKKIKSLFN